MPRAHTLERRRRDHGQPFEPQGTQGRTIRKRRRRRVALAAALQPGHEPDRKGPFHAGGVLAKNRGGTRRWVAGRPRRLRQRSQTCRTRRLIPRLRLRYRLTERRYKQVSRLGSARIQSAYVLPPSRPSREKRKRGIPADVHLAGEDSCPNRRDRLSRRPQTGPG